MHFVKTVCVMVLLSLIARAQQPTGVSSDGRILDKEAFNQKVTQMMAEVGVPGLSLAIIDNNKVSYYRTYGVKDRAAGNKVDDETTFIGCSLSKCFLVFVAHQLVDEGKLDLDKPMYQYMEYELLAHDARYKLITPRMILSHSSGIENVQHQYSSSTLDIVANPGERFVYSGEGYVYLSLVIEKILGQTYEEYIKERIVKPLRLENTYLKYEKVSTNNGVHQEIPSNYAVGHLLFGQTNTIKNDKTFPAFGNHFSAADFAKLITAIFDTTHLSVNRINDLVKPLIEEGKSVYYGPGLELFIGNDDIIIFHGGNCEGYRNYFFYSLINKKGVVYLSNSDLGDVMASQLCKYAVGMDIDPFINAVAGLSEQYPHSYLPEILNIYNNKGAASMFSALERLQREDKLGDHFLVILGILFGGVDNNIISKALFVDNLSMNPDDPVSYAFLGNIYLEDNALDSALFCFKKAKELNFDLWSIDAGISDCEKRIAELDRRSSVIFPIGADKPATIQSEDYTMMKGAKVYGYYVGGISSGDWMSYKSNIVEGGIYSLSFKVASLTEGGKFQLWTDNKLLTTVDIPATSGWENWITVTTNVDFHKGRQILKLYASSGGFNIDEVCFKKAAARAND